MNNKIYKRIINEANYIIDTKSTIREIAKVMKVSKSTVHKDLHERLFYININLFNQVKEILDYHTQIRHINGGKATKVKYLKSRKG